ncbi:MAG: hypothetical protein EXX96DRAFT_641836 [Benjaminiella poitrasii]|nr:MAG: hypothetical protein EXX96DRAFT_641836 [Benjaminiella poitrasii]
MTIICTIFLDALQEPVALNCGHVFDKAWFVFPRTKEKPDKPTDSFLFHNSIQHYFNVSHLCPNCKRQTSPHEQPRRLYLSTNDSPPPPPPSSSKDSGVLSLRTHQHIVSAMTDQIAELTKRVETSEASFRPTLQELEKLKSHKDLNNKNYATLIASANRLASVNQALQTKLDESHNTGTQLTNENVVLKLRNVQLDKTNASLYAENQKVRKEAELAKTTHAWLMKDLRVQATQAEEVRVQNELLRRGVEELTRAKTGLEADVESLKNVTDEISQGISKLKAENERMRLKLNERRIQDALPRV